MTTAKFDSPHDVTVFSQSEQPLTSHELWAGLRNLAIYGSTVGMLTWLAARAEPVPIIEGFWTLWF